MPPPDGVVQWVHRVFPRPVVDPEWLDACYTWVVTEHNLTFPADRPQILSQIEAQLLGSDLQDSMLPGTGLPINISELVSTRLSSPVLVEVTAITEIGHSAFTLQQTRQTRIDRADMGEEAAQVAEEDEGPVPKYPRTMLKLQLSDGATTLQAIEYRPLPEFTLGVTPLGYKMVLKNVLIRRGIAFLEPKCVTMKGHLTADREASQDSDFARGLRMRLGQPELEAEADAENINPAAPPSPPRPAPAAVSFDNTSLREWSEVPDPPRAGPSHTTHSNDEDQLYRRNKPPSSSDATLLQSSYFSSTTNSSFSRDNRKGRMLALSPARSGLITLPVGDGEDPDVSPSGTLVSAEKLRQPAPSLSWEDDWGISEEQAIAMDQELQDPVNNKDKGKGKAPVGDQSSDDDFGDDDIEIDEAFLQEIDRVELQAIESSAPLPTSKSGSSYSSPIESTKSMLARREVSVVSKRVIDVIMIEDDEDDKENVPTLMQCSQKPLSQPLILGDEIIIISDSE